MHEAIDDLEAVKLACEAGRKTLANVSTAMDKSHQATDRYFDVRRKALG